MTQEWAEAIERVLGRMEDTAGRVGDRFPHWADQDTGEWVTTADGDWTGGYWVGMHWLAHHVTGRSSYAERAAPLVGRLGSRASAETVFKSFPVYYGAALGSVLAGDEAADALARETAASLVGQFDPVLGLIPLGRAAEEGSTVGATETSIDSLHAAPFLLWAAGETGDPTMRDVATRHADRVIALHLRPDGSFIQSTSLEPGTGAVVRHYTHKGHSDTSTWGRAQAWGMLFTAMSFSVGSRSLSAPRAPWIDAAARGARWWLDHVPADLVAYWDFDDPAIPDTERDTAATAIAAAALLKLGCLAPDADARAAYVAAAAATTRALVGGYLTPTSPDDRRVPGILTGTCFNKRSDARAQDAAARCEFVVADYYLLETLLGLSGGLDPALV